MYVRKAAFAKIETHQILAVGSLVCLKNERLNQKFIIFIGLRAVSYALRSLTKIAPSYIRVEPAAGVLLNDT